MNIPSGDIVNPNVTSDWDTMKQTLPDFKLRLPQELKDKIEAIAKENYRSMNAEIVSRLEFSFAADVVVQETGWDVGHGHETPEFRVAYQRSQPLEKRVADLEDQVAALLKMINKK